ncbi:hypothetical protein [Azospirillum argentinense]|uniref:hypothetical protein n=1 Tax=Azospirillum argentinense TaxID=2970906 RepID=UPI0032DE8F82
MSNTTPMRDQIRKRARPHAGGWAWDLDGFRSWSKEHPAHPPVANSNEPSWRAEWAEVVRRASA